MKKGFDMERFLNRTVDWFVDCQKNRNGSQMQKISQITDLPIGTTGTVFGIFAQSGFISSSDVP